MATVSLIEERRREIAAAITQGLQQDGWQPWRVHAYPPTQVAAPCIWVDMPQLTVTPPYMLAEFPVVLHLDGADQAQLLAFDMVVARVWDAIQVVRDTAPTTAITKTADVGGPSARRYVITVQSVLASEVLCQPASALSLSTP